MIEETGRVVRREGDHVWVEAERQSTCGGCTANKGCGTGVLARVLGRKAVEVRALNTVDAQVGDAVVIGFREDALVRGSLAVYLVPLLTMMGGGLVGESLAPRLGLNSPEIAGIVAGVGGLIAGFAWLRRFSRGLARDERYIPRTVRRFGKQPTAAIAFLKSRDYGLGER